MVALQTPNFAATCATVSSFSLSKTPTAAPKILGQGWDKLGEIGCESVEISAAGDSAESKNSAPLPLLGDPM